MTKIIKQYKPKKLKNGHSTSKKKERRIEVSNKSGKELGRVSTVFLGIDHRNYCSPEQKINPILFETMVFAENTCMNKQQKRCCNYKDAIEMHDKTAKELSDCFNDANAEHKYPLEDRKIC